jgi:hypothetical protein
MIKIANVIGAKRTTSQFAEQTTRIQISAARLTTLPRQSDRRRGIKAVFSQGSASLDTIVASNNVPSVGRLLIEERLPLSARHGSIPNLLPLAAGSRFPDQNLPPALNLATTRGTDTFAK